MKKDDLRANLRVWYGVTLPSWVGVVVSVGKTPHGGDCLVKWDNTGNTTEECAANLSKTAIMCRPAVTWGKTR
jgi:hypothetical protein